MLTGTVFGEVTKSILNWLVTLKAVQVYTSNMQTVGYVIYVSISVFGFVFTCASDRTCTLS